MIKKDAIFVITQILAMAILAFPRKNCRIALLPSLRGFAKAEAIYKKPIKDSSNFKGNAESTQDSIKSNKTAESQGYSNHSTNTADSLRDSVESCNFKLVDCHEATPLAMTILARIPRKNLQNLAMMIP